MRRLILTAITIAASLQLFSQDPTIIEIDNKQISLSEFEYLYNKNNSSAILEQKTIDEYIDLFIKFKLKVHDAEVKGLDTAATYLRELNGYRNQLAKPYLTDSKLEESLYQEAYSHFSQDCEVSHILFNLKSDATPEDTLIAYNKAINAIKRLEKEDFQTVAKAVSEDQSVAKNGGYLGFFTALQTVWSFEKAMYEQPINTISQQPIRTNYGYHIIKVHSRRPAYGQVHAQHIMKLCNDKMTKTEQENARTQINNISSKLRNDGNFEELAKLFSDDKGTAKRGGDLSWFGINRMVPEFEKAAFALKVNQISEPIKTQFGWHIIKVTGKRQVESFEKKKADIHRIMQYDYRSTAALKSFIEQIKKEYNFQVNNEVENTIKHLIEKSADQNITLQAEGKNLTDVLFSYNDEKVLATEFIEYYTAQNGKLEYEKAFEQFVNTELIAYEDKHLEKKHPEFAHLIQEYHDGILLFEISNQEVWNKALTDTDGIVKFFNNNVDNYTWDETRYKGLIVKCADKTIAKQVKKEIKGLKDFSLIDSITNKFNTDSTTVVTIENGLWKKGENQFVDKFGFKNKKATAPISEELPIVYLVGKKQNVPDSYTDVRGAVTADYQNYLEEEWIKSLEKKYKVIIHDDIIKLVK